MAAERGTSGLLQSALRQVRLRAAVVLRFAVCWATVALAGCVGFDVEAVRELDPETNDAFSRTLAEEYRDFALVEADEMADWFVADHFARKSLRAGAGEAVEPEALEDWRLPREALPQLQEARQVLVTALEERGADDEAAELAAWAQSRFDCWVEQQEENHQWDDIAECRDGFYRNIRDLSIHLEALRKADLKAAALPEPAPAPEEDEGVPFAVTLFDFDSAALSGSGRVAVQAAAEEAARAPEARVVVIGHTDRSGPDAYNLELSLRRGDVVREALIADGVEAARIEVTARGEWDPAVPTADGVREPANRRVEIFFQQEAAAPAPTSQHTQMPLAPAGQEADAQDASPVVGRADVDAAPGAPMPRPALAWLPAEGISAAILPDPGCVPTPRCLAGGLRDGPPARRLRPAPAKATGPPGPLRPARPLPNNLLRSH